MPTLDLTDENKYNLDIPVVNPIPEPSTLDRELAAYASALTSEAPMTQYKQIMTEMEYAGKSANLDSILNRLKVDENKELQKSVATIISDPSVPKEEKQQALQYYAENRDILPSLKERYTTKIAITNPNANADMDAFIQGFSEKEQAVDEIQQEINKTGASLSGSTLGAFGGLLIEILPFVGAGFKGYQLSEIKQAIDGKDYGVLRSVWRGIMQGSAEKDIRDAITAIPTTEGKKAAINRILEVIKEMPGTDYNKYTALRESVEGDLENWEKNLFNVLGVFGAVVGVTAALKTGGRLVKDTAKVTVTPTVSPTSMLGRTAAHNSALASKMAGSAVVDESGEVAAAIGAKQHEIVSDMLSKPDNEVRHALGVEASAETRAIIDGIDEQGKLALSNTAHNYVLYPKEMMDELSTVIKDTVLNAKAASVHLGKSTFNIGDTGVSGTAVFGKTDEAPFQSYQEALDAAKALAPDLPEGAITIVKLGRGGKLRPTYNIKPTIEIVERTITEKVPVTKKRTVEKDIEDVAQPISLPKELSGAKPRYKTDEISFADDFSKAAYLLSNPLTKSKAHDKYLEWAKKISGMTEEEIVSFGRKVKEGLKTATKNEEGKLTSTVKLGSRTKTNKKVQVEEEYQDFETVTKTIKEEKRVGDSSAATLKGDHYLQFNYAKEVTAQDIVLFGPDAVRIRFDMFGREVKSVSNLLSRIALSGGKVGNYLFAHHAMPAKAASAAFTSFDKALAVEEPFLTYARRFVSQQSSENRRMVDELLKEGEDFAEGGQLGKVFNYDEVIHKSIAKGLSNSEAEEVAKGYYVYRRVADWMYTLADRSKSKALRDEGFSWITPSGSGRVAGKVVSKGEVEDIRTVVDQATGNVVPLSRKDIDTMYDQGESLIRLAYPLKQGDTVVRYARIGKSFSDAPIEGGALPYIRGYVPRGYDNQYFVVRTPTKMDLDGHTVTDRATLEKNRSTHAAADSMLDAEQFRKKLQDADPAGIYSVKRERLSEKSILEQGDVFRQNMIHSSRRGSEALENGRQLDPLVGLMSLIQSLSKKAAMEEFLTVTKKDFVRQYGDFLAVKGEFPTGADKIISKANMTIAESDKLKQARAVYNWLEGMMIMQRYDSGLWKDVMYGAGEFAEKFAPVFGSMLRGIGKHYPMDYLRKISTAMFISLRPARQILLQPSQLVLYSAIDTKLLNPLESMRFIGKIGALGLTKFYKNGSSIGNMIPDELIIKAGAKMFGQTDKEFVATLESFKNSGLLQSIDSNLLVDGLYSQKHKKLVETFAEKAVRNVEASVGVLPRLGRTIGFDRGEEINLAGSWLIARDRFARMNPDVDINSRFAGESIASTARELAFSMSRPGAFQYQKNALSLPLQFIAAPHKDLLSFTTSKTLTAQEKARLMAGHFIMYGSAGLGIQQFVLGDGVSGIPGLDLRAKMGSEVPEEVFTAIEGGLADWGVNTLANMMLDEEGEKTRLDIAHAFSPLSGGVLPFGQFLDSLNEDPFAVTILGPSWNIVDPAKGRLTTAIRDISSMMRGDEDTSANFKDIAYRAMEITSGGTDWMKYRMARDFDLLVASSGYKLDDHITSAEIVGKLFGVGTIRERVQYELIKKFSDENKEIKAAVKYIYDGFWKVAPIYGDDPKQFERYNKTVSAYMSTIQDPLLKRKMQEEFRKYSQQQMKTLGESVSTQLYKGAASKSAEQLNSTFNTLESYGMKEQADVIRNLIGVEQ